MVCGLRGHLPQTSTPPSIGSLLLPLLHTQLSRPAALRLLACSDSSQPCERASRRASASLALAWVAARAALAAASCSWISAAAPQTSSEPSACRQRSSWRRQPSSVAPRRHCRSVLESAATQRAAKACQAASAGWPSRSSSGGVSGSPAASGSGSGSHVHRLFAGCGRRGL